MPIYEYRCDSCGHEFEAMQKFSDAPLAECPACGKSMLKKLVSAAGFHLKGSGWYATDFKGGAKKTDTKPEGDKSSASSSSTDSGSTEPKKHGCGSGGCGSH